MSMMMMEQEMDSNQDESFNNCSSHYQTPLNSSIEEDDDEENTGASTTRDVESEILIRSSKNFHDDENSLHIGQISPGSQASSTLVDEENHQQQDDDNQQNHYVVHHTFDIKPSHGRADLQGKFRTILSTVQYLQAECQKMQNYEKKILTMAMEIRQFRQNLLNHHNDLLESLNQFVQMLGDSSQSSSSSSSSTTSSASSNRSYIVSTISSARQNSNLPDWNTIRYKLRKLPAMIRGYLVRRLMKTERVESLRRTIRDTSAILVNFKNHLIINRQGKFVVTHEDVLFHKRLCQQLERSCREFYGIFFELSIRKRMEIIQQHRERLIRRKFSGITSSSSSSRRSSASVRMNH